MILEMTHGFGKCFYAKWPEKMIIYSIPWQYHDTLLVAVGHLCKHCKFKYWSHISHIICHSHRILLICSPHIHRLGHFGSSSNSEDTKVLKTTNQFNDTKNLRYPPVSTTLPLHLCRCRNRLLNGCAWIWLRLFQHPWAASMGFGNHLTLW